MWNTPQTYSVAQQVPENTPGAEPFSLNYGTFKAEKAWCVSLVISMCISRDILTFIIRVS